MQRSHLTDAFLPLTSLAESVPVLESMAEAMVVQWRRAENLGADSVLDVRAWMHHAALAMFIRCMLGDSRAYGPVPSGDGVQDLSGGAEDLPFAATTPANSAAARAVFNLEDAGRVVSREHAERRFAIMIGFASKLLARAEAREKSGGTGGPLMDRLRSLGDDAIRMQNLLAMLVAGHDTTAYTMQFCLLELARDQALQDRVRAETCRILREVERRGTPLAYGDLPRFELLTRCIMETLRLWNVAAVVFSRVTGFDDVVKGANGEDVRVPAGTKFTFWYYAQHHSALFWGEDPMRFNPDREWSPRELQQAACRKDGQPRGTAMTPCTERFHPFSVPSRDCLGKGFAMTEMRILLPRIIRAFRLEVPQHGAAPELASVSPQAGHPLYERWSREIGGPPQPHALLLKITPLSPASSTSRL